MVMIVRILGGMVAMSLVASLSVRVKKVSSRELLMLCVDVLDSGYCSDIFKNSTTPYKGAHWRQRATHNLMVKSKRGTRSVEREANANTHLL